MTDDSAKRNKDSKDVKKGIKENNHAPSTVTNHGDTFRDITGMAVDSGPSLRKKKGIDKADIYSTGESGMRHIERAPEKTVKK